MSGCPGNEQAVSTSPSRRLRRPIRCALLAFAFASPAAAWNATGHMVAARIAWDQMRPQVRQRAVELLAAAPSDAGLAQLLARDSRPLDRRQREHFARAATWPDIVRDRDFRERYERYHRGDWHWLNQFWEQGPDGEARELTERRPAGRLVERLGALTESLGDPIRPAGARAVDLAWILHLVGDSHQPLHTTARVTPTEPEGDRGGNLFELARRSNLHAYWDGTLSREYWRYFWHDADEHAGRLAAMVTRRHPRSTLADEVSETRFEAWAREGLEITKRSVYPAELERGRKPPRGYARAVEKIAERRIALAGYRLSELLTRVLGR